MWHILDTPLSLIKIHRIILQSSHGLCIDRIIPICLIHSFNSNQNKNFFPKKWYYRQYSSYAILATFDVNRFSINKRLKLRIIYVLFCFGLLQGSNQILNHCLSHQILFSKRKSIHRFCCVSNETVKQKSMTKFLKIKTKKFEKWSNLLFAIWMQLQFPINVMASEKGSHTELYPEISSVSDQVNVNSSIKYPIVFSLASTMYTSIISQSDQLASSISTVSTSSFVSTSISPPANYTLSLLSNTTNSTEEQMDHNYYILPLYQQIIWCLIFGIMVFVATGGNIIVIWIVMTHKRMASLVFLTNSDRFPSIFNVSKILCFSIVDEHLKKFI